MYSVNPVQASKLVNRGSPGDEYHPPVFPSSLLASLAWGLCRFWPPSRLRCVMVGGRSRPLPANRVRLQVQIHRWPVLALSLQAWGSGHPFQVGASGLRTGGGRPLFPHCGGRGAFGWPSLLAGLLRAPVGLFLLLSLPLLRGNAPAFLHVGSASFADRAGRKGVVRAVEPS